VEGPLVRWISKVEEVTVKVNVMHEGVRPPSGCGYASGYHQYAGSQHYPNVVNGQPSASGSGPGSCHYPNAVSNQVSAFPTPTYQSASSSQPQSQPPTPYSYAPNPDGAVSQQSHPPLIPQPMHRIEKVCKNYVVHEVSQTFPAQKPPWQDTMAALFGGDVKWEEMRVWTGKGRPLCSFICFSHSSIMFLIVFPPFFAARPKQTCPLTGLQARYLDPRTNVPFANVRAYQTLTKILKHDYIWSETLRCYVGVEGGRRAMGIEGKAGGKGEEKGKRKARESDIMEVS